VVGVNSTELRDSPPASSGGGAACDDGRVTATSSPDVGVPEISRDELLRSLRDRTITLVDVLSPESFAATHIPGAISLPVLDIARRAATVLPDHRARIVTYCGGPT
jgi:hypothetical protein